MTKALFRIDEAAAYLAVDRRTVYRLLGAGELAGLKVRGATRIRSQALDDFIKRQAAAWEAENGFVCQEVTAVDPVK